MRAMLWISVHLLVMFLLITPHLDWLFFQGEGAVFLRIILMIWMVASVYQSIMHTRPHVIRLWQILRETDSAQTAKPISPEHQD